jgi:hypothetical protein
MSPLARGDDRGRLAGGVLLLAAVHVALLVLGNDRATPLRLVASFATTTLVLLAAQRLRRRARRGVEARSSVRPTDRPSPPPTDGGAPAAPEVPR